MNDRICFICNREVIWGQPDPCFGFLPGVTNACCGHGNTGYIQFENGIVVRFPSAATDQMMEECSDPECPELEEGEAKVVINGQIARGWTWGHSHFPWGETLQHLVEPDEEVSPAVAVLVDIRRPSTGK